MIVKDGQKIDNALNIIDKNEVYASGQAIREASLTVLRPTVYGSETSRTQKRSDRKSVV